uniref:CCHC-type domain-containing protein n=1 Tax=Tetraodon nigroviridis TaxID=99883 RepID=H3C3A8_TETNG
PVLPLTQPATRITLSNVPPFISDIYLINTLWRATAVLSPMKKILSGCKSPLLKHVVSHRRQVFMILNNRSEEFDYRFMVKVDGYDYQLFATSSLLKCFGCGEEGHIVRACPNRAGSAGARPGGSAAGRYGKNGARGRRREARSCGAPADRRPRTEGAAAEQQGEHGDHTEVTSGGGVEEMVVEGAGEVGEVVGNTGEKVGETGEQGGTGERVGETGEVQGETGEVQGETGEKVEVAGERVGGRSDSGAPGGLVGELSTAGETPDLLGEVVEIRSETGGRSEMETGEAAGTQRESAATACASVVDPRVLESVFVCASASAPAKQRAKRTCCQEWGRGVRPGGWKARQPSLLSATARQRQTCQTAATCPTSPLPVRKINTIQKI